MTNREAIEMLKREMKPWIKWNADAYVQLGLDVQGSLDMAIQALEKQEPKLVLNIENINTDFRDDFDELVGMCPTCKNKIAKRHNKYICGHKGCGQAIDWSE